MNVMTRAWEIAKEGQKKFGGKVKEYLVEALKMAWAELKKVKEYVTIETLCGSRKHKTWVAKIVGTCSTYKYKREFIEEYEEGGVYKFWNLYNGVYDVCDGGDRYYAKVENGEIVEISNGQLAEIFA